MGEMPALCHFPGSTRCPLSRQGRDRSQARIWSPRAKQNKMKRNKTPNALNWAPTWPIWGARGEWGPRSAHRGRRENSPRPGSVASAAPRTGCAWAVCHPVGTGQGRVWGRGDAGARLGLGGRAGRRGRGGAWPGGRLGAVPGGGAPASGGPAVPRRAPPRAAC